MMPQNPLIAFDYWLLTKINLDWTNGFFDWFFPFITDLQKNPYSLIVMLPLLAFWFYKKRLQALKCMLALVIAISCADSFSFRVLKSHIDRPRPPDSGIAVNIRTHRYSGRSFPSNHATNIFAAAVVLSAAMPMGAPLFFLIAVLVGYSRVYVGVHFPLDVLGGALVGSIFGLAVWLAMRRWIQPSSRDEATRATTTTEDQI